MMDEEIMAKLGRKFQEVGGAGGGEGGCAWMSARPAADPLPPPMDAMWRSHALPRSSAIDHQNIPDPPLPTPTHPHPQIIKDPEVAEKLQAAREAAALTAGEGEEEEEEEEMDEIHAAASSGVCVCGGGGGSLLLMKIVQLIPGPFFTIFSGISFRNAVSLAVATSPARRHLPWF
jgi:hypothetical protein